MGNGNISTSRGLHMKFLSPSSHWKITDDLTTEILKNTGKHVRELEGSLNSFLSEEGVKTWTTIAVYFYYQLFIRFLRNNCLYRSNQRSNRNSVNTTATLRLTGPASTRHFARNKSSTLSTWEIPNWRKNNWHD